MTKKAVEEAKAEARAGKAKAKAVVEAAGAAGVVVVEAPNKENMWFALARAMSVTHASSEDPVGDIEEGRVRVTTALGGGGGRGASAEVGIDPHLVEYMRRIVAPRGGSGGT